MPLQLYNTLPAEVEEFAPSVDNTVRMYSCGPTVYDYGHIGNFRTFVAVDILRRFLRQSGFKLDHVMNITDVDDKIIRRVQEDRVPLRQLTGQYESAFLEDLKALHCLEPHHKPRATEHIPEIVLLIEKLLARGLAYKAADGSIYFSIEKYRAAGGVYGRLVQLNSDALRPGERVRSDEYAKESAADFALWKARSAEDGDIFWPGPFGEGRPGWHIECSAMSMKILGAAFELHVGGEDLIFPHHEDEIAQSEGATGKPFVKYWLHGAHLLVEGRKMSKSLGNFFTLRDLVARGFTGREIRYLLLSAHYRETFNFTLEGLNGAKAALARLDECMGKLRALAPGPGTPASASASAFAKASADRTADKTADKTADRCAGADGSGHRPPLQGTDAAAQRPYPSDYNALALQRFSDALDEDLNVSAAWGVVFEWVGELNRRLARSQLAPGDAAAALTTWEKIVSVLGVGTAPGAEVPAQISALVQAREAARKEKNFKRADEIRGDLASKGWAVEDSANGPKLKRR